MKRYAFVFALLFLLAFSVAAINELDPATDNVLDAMGQALIAGIKWLFTSILGFLTEGAKFLVGDGMLMARVFLFILLLFFVHTALDMSGILSKNRIIVFGVSVVIVALTMIALPGQFISLIFPLYDSLFTTLVVFVTFALLMFATIRTNNPLIARLIWVVTAIIFTLVFFTKGIDSFSQSNMTWGIILLSLSIISVVMAIFTPIIRDWFLSAEILDLEQKANMAADIDAAVTKKHINEAKADRDIVKKRR